MSEIFYGLQRSPFPVVADPASVFQASGHRAALLALTELVGRGVGTIVVEADAGAGKSALLQDYRRQIDPVRVRTLLLSRADFDARILNNSLVDELLGPFNRLNDIADLDQHLLNHKRAGGATVVLVDNAERLGRAAWAGLARLIMVGAPQESAVTVVLAGRPPLSAQLGAPGRSAFKSRTTARVNLANWSAADSEQFIRHSLIRAGAENPDAILSAEAIHRIAAVCAGSPARLVSTSAAILQRGAARREQPVQLASVDRCLRRSTAPMYPWLRGAGIAAAIFLAAAVGWQVLPSGENSSLPPAIQSADAALPMSPVDPEPAPPPVGAAPPARVEALAEDESVDVFLLPAQPGDTLRRLYKAVYTDPATRPSFDRFLAANAGTAPDQRVNPGMLIGFPGPFGPTWRDAQNR